MKTRTTTIARELSVTLSRLNNLRNMPNGDASGAESELSALLDMLPSGSGIDCGTKLDEDRTNAQRLVFIVDHHMSEHGYYDGWTTYTVTCRPAFDGIDITISGRDRNGVKDYLTETYHFALSRLIEATWNAETRETEYVDVAMREAQEAYRKSLA